MAALEHSNPFVLLMDPQSVMRAVERSERLSRIKGRICRPLDRPLIPRTHDSSLARFDAEIDSMECDDEDLAAEGARELS